jgi:hypothetical protein
LPLSSPGRVKCHSASHVLRSPDSMIKDRNCRYKPGSFNLGPELSMWDGSFEEIPIDRLGHLTLSVIPYLKVPTKLSSGSLPAIPHDDSNGKTLTETGQLTKSLGRYLFLSLIPERAEKPRVRVHAPIRAPTPPLLACRQGQLGKPCLPRSAANSTLRRYEIYARFDFYSRRLALLHKLRIPDNGGKLHCSVAPPSHSTAIRAVPLAIMLSFAFC